MSSHCLYMGGEPCCSHFSSPIPSFVKPLLYMGGGGGGGGLAAHTFLHPFPHQLPMEKSLNRDVSMSSALKYEGMAGTGQPNRTEVGGGDRGIQDIETSTFTVYPGPSKTNRPLKATLAIRCICHWSGNAATERQHGCEVLSIQCESPQSGPLDPNMGNLSIKGM